MPPSPSCRGPIPCLQLEVRSALFRSGGRAPSALLVSLYPRRTTGWGGKGYLRYSLWLHAWRYREEALAYGRHMHYISSSFCIIFFCYDAAWDIILCRSSSLLTPLQLGDPPFSPSSFSLSSPMASSNSSSSILAPYSCLTRALAATMAATSAVKKGTTNHCWGGHSRCRRPQRQC